MKIKIKLLSDKAKLPVKGTPDSAGYDLTAASVFWDRSNNIISYGFGIALEIPKGYVGLVFPRSSIAKKSLTLTNCVGVIDSNYRGEILAKFKNTTGDSVPAVYPIGAKIAQLIIMPYPIVNLIESDELSSTERGEGGFGSSDKETNSDDQELNNTETEVENMTSESTEQTPVE